MGEEDNAANSIQPTELPKKSEHTTSVDELPKYLALALLLVMPFAGGWIGYQQGVESALLKPSTESGKTDATTYGSDAVVFEMSSIDGSRGGYNVHVNSYGIAEVEYQEPGKEKEFYRGRLSVLETEKLINYFESDNFQDLKSIETAANSDKRVVTVSVEDERGTRTEITQPFADMSDDFEQIYNNFVIIAQESKERAVTPNSAHNTEDIAFVYLQDGALSVHEKPTRIYSPSFGQPLLTVPLNTDIFYSTTTDDQTIFVTRTNHLFINSFSKLSEEEFVAGEERNKEYEARNGRFWWMGGKFWDTLYVHAYNAETNEVESHFSSNDTEWPYMTVSQVHRSGRLALFESQPCTACHGAYPKSFVYALGLKVHQASKQVPLGEIAAFEWTGPESFRYKKFVYEDPHTVCEMRCRMTQTSHLPWVEYSFGE